MFLIHIILGNKTADNEENEILHERISQYEEKIKEIMQNNKLLVEENNELLDRVQLSKNYATELKTRYVSQMCFVRRGCTYLTKRLSKLLIS